MFRILHHFNPFGEMRNAISSLTKYLLEALGPKNRQLPFILSSFERL